MVLCFLLPILLGCLLSLGHPSTHHSQQVHNSSGFGDDPTQDPFIHDQQQPSTKKSPPAVICHNETDMTSTPYPPTSLSPYPQTNPATGNTETNSEEPPSSTTDIDLCHNKTTSDKVPTTIATFVQTENPQSTAGNLSTSPSDPSTTYENILSSTPTSSYSETESTTKNSPTDQTSHSKFYSNTEHSAIFSTSTPKVTRSTSKNSPGVSGDSTAYGSFSKSIQTISTNTNTPEISETSPIITNGSTPSTKIYPINTLDNTHPYSKNSPTNQPSSDPIYGSFSTTRNLSTSLPYTAGPTGHETTYGAQQPSSPSSSPAPSQSPPPSSSSSSSSSPSSSSSSSPSSPAPSQSSPPPPSSSSETEATPCP